MEQIALQSDNGEEVLVYVVEEATVAGQKYLLVAFSEEGDSEALILKETGEEGDEVVYDVVEDDNELEAVSKLFEALIDDTDLE